MAWHRSHDTVRMTGGRRQGREAALQVIYLRDLTGDRSEAAIMTGWMMTELSPKTKAFADRLIEGATAHLASLDQVIQKVAENWELSRMAAVDRAILRLAAYELVYEIDTPINVIINEAVEIAKQYSTAESGKFVNGILDKVKLERKSTS